MSARAPQATPPPRLPRTLLNLALAAAFGIVAGLGLFTFIYAEGLSYFSDDPAACVNCHVMNDQFNSWNHSSHKAVAACNDCHTPHGTYVEKYIVKGINGWNHSLAFTTGNFPDPIRIRGFNADIAQQNCIECHAGAISQMHVTGSLDRDQLYCIACHGNVGHGQASQPLHGPIFPTPAINPASSSSLIPADPTPATHSTTLSTGITAVGSLNPESPGAATD